MRQGRAEFRFCAISEGFVSKGEFREESRISNLEFRSSKAPGFEILASKFEIQEYPWLRFVVALRRRLS
jgi:hypothetical protein